MGKHGKSKYHSKSSKASRSDSESSDSERVSDTIFGLQENAPSRKYTFPTTMPSQPTPADFHNIVRNFLSTSLWTQSEHAACTSEHALALAILKHAPHGDTIVPEEALPGLRNAANAFPSFKNNLELLERELPTRRARYAAEALDSADEADGHPGSGGGWDMPVSASEGASETEEYYSVESPLNHILESEELYQHVDHPQLFGILYRCAVDVTPSMVDKQYEVSMKDLCEHLYTKDPAVVEKVKDSVAERIRTLKRDLLTKMHVLKPKPARKSVKKRHEDSDVYPVPEIGNNDGIPKPRLSIADAHSIG
jgi:hypothetical protein